MPVWIGLGVTGWETKNSMGVGQIQTRKARNDLLKTIYEDLVGPEGETEIISEAPTTRYSAGVLFPREETEGQEEVLADRSLQAGDDRPLDEEEAEGLIEQTSSFYPSAMGLSFVVDKN